MPLEGWRYVCAVAHWRGIAPLCGNAGERSSMVPPPMSARTAVTIGRSIAGSAHAEI